VTPADLGSRMGLNANAIYQMVASRGVV
jgi:hypothetical protein